MATDVENDGFEARYSELLQPIRDLTVNWNVDVASYLNDYLDELGETMVSFDGGQTKMNFAQAAMLLQGSASIYNKKVEYLHSLVFQLVDFLSHKKKQQQKQKTGGDDDDDNDDGWDPNDDEDFLSLDDIPEGKDIYLKEDFDSREEFKLLPLIPPCLIALDEGEKGDNPLLSKTGEVLASRNDFRMNTCCMDADTGALLLDMSHLDLLRESLTLLQQLTAQTAPKSTDGEGLAQEKEQGSPDTSHHSLPSGDHEDVDEPPGMDVDMPAAGIDDDQPAHDEPPLQENIGDRLRPRDKKREKIVAKQKFDPWEPLDPHAETGPLKPAKKTGRLYSYPPGIEDKTKKRKRSKPTQPLEPLSKYIERSFFSNEHKYPKNPLKQPTLAGLDRYFWAEYKRRQALEKELIKQRREARKTVTDPGQENEEEDWEGGDELPPEDDDEPLTDDRLYQAIDDAVSMMCHSQDLTSPRIDPFVAEAVLISYEDLVRKHVDEFMASCQQFAQITELSQRVGDWEDKILPQLEEEEGRAPFDINVLSTSVMGNLHRGHTVPFREVVKGSDKHQVAQMFLASLMLANTGNVQIGQHGKSGSQKSMDTFELELLSTQRHFEQLQEYQAPSVTHS